MARDEDVKAVLERLRAHNEVIRQLVETEEGRQALHEFVWREGILFGHLLEHVGELESDVQRTTRPEAGGATPAATAGAAGGAVPDIPKNEQEKQRLWQRAKAWFGSKGGSITEKLFDKVNDFVKGAIGLGSGK